MSERSGILEFTIGLSTGGFLHSLGDATSGLKTFIASTIGVGAIIEGIKSQIEKGAGLEHLSKRTGESVSDLFQLQRGFEAAGLSADDVGVALFQMRKSLGGVNEMGERTDDIFRRLSLNAQTLKHMGGMETLKTILTQISHLNQTSATTAAVGIFGRMEAGNMLQLSRSVKETINAMGASAGTAALFERDAVAFERMERATRELKYRLTDAFAVGAEFTIAFVEAWKSGQISELIAKSIITGFKVAADFIPVIIETLRAVSMDWMPKLAENKYHEGKLRDLADDRKNARTVSEVFAIDEKIKQENVAHETKLAAIAGNIQKEWLSINQDFTKAIQAVNLDTQGLKNMVRGLLPKSKSAEGFADKPGNEDLLPTEPYRMQFTALEKMGAVMRGLGNPIRDENTIHLREVAQNTRRIVQQLAIHNGFGGGFGGGALINQPI